MNNKLISDSECKQGRCANPTTGCFGKCYISQHPEWPNVSLSPKPPKQQEQSVEAATLIERKAALRTHENGGQESEAGAVAEVMGTETDMYIGVPNLNNWSRLPAGTKLYLAPPSTLAIETAAIMKCMEKVNEWVNPYNDNAAAQIVLALEALIPQDGRTALFDKCTEVAEAVNQADRDRLRWHGNGTIEQLDVLCDTDTSAIVTNLIGVPPLSSETGESK